MLHVLIILLCYRIDNSLSEHDTKHMLRPLRSGNKVKSKCLGATS